MFNFILFHFVTIFLFLPSFSLAERHPDGFTYKECSPQREICEYWLNIQEKLTMIFHKDLVYADNGRLYLYNEHPSNYSTVVPPEKVVTVDGVNRMIEAVNDTLPGPPIVAYEGQTMIIHIKNTLLSNAATLHFHGLHQRDTSYFDGMPYVTQCPIGAGQTFTHKFKVQQTGTYWYHSHIGSQRTNGVYGAFIIKKRYSPGVIPPTDMIMHVGDWHHENSDEVYVKMVYGNFIGRNRYETTGTHDGGHFSGVPWVSALINGRGRYIDPNTGKKIMAPLSWFNVTKGAAYRFRVIGAGSLYPLRISVDNHVLRIISSDGYDFQEFKAESFIINPGERYDFILDANQPYGNYWIRAVSLEENAKDHTVEAILHYKQAPDSEPSTTRKDCTQNESCIILNCPFDFFPEEYNIRCHRISEMKSADVHDETPEWKDDSEEHFLNFAFPGQKVTPGSVNGRKFEYPGINSLFQGQQVGQMKDYDCKNHDCGDDKICYCHYELSIPYNKTIQMVWLNMGNGAGYGHPMHIHGHSFYLLKLEYAKSENKTGMITEHTSDINCGGGLNFCNSAKWTDPSWENGNVPGLNLKNPPRKDTVIVPTGGYAVIRIRSDNPGKWFLHCHIEVHALDGMGMIINEAPDHPLKPPKGFPSCVNFYDDNSRDIDYVESNLQALQNQFPNNDTIGPIPQCAAHKESLFIIVSAALGAVILVQVFIIFTCAINRRKTESDKA